MLRGRFSFNLISVTHKIKWFHVQICHRGLNLIIRVILDPFLESQMKGGPNLRGHAEKFKIVFFSQNFLGVPLNVGKSGKILGPTVNVKFFTVDPYTLGNRVSRTFPIWPILQVWSHLGKKTSKGKSNMDSFWTIWGFLGHQNDFWKVLTQNSVKKNTGHIAL